MASRIIKRVSVSRIQNDSFITAVAGALFILLVTASTLSASPIDSGNTISGEQAENLTAVRKQIYWGTELLTILESNLGNAISEIQQPGEDELSLKVLCNMYDIYRDHTFFLSTVLPDDPNHANYISAQFAAWKATKSACEWTCRNNSEVIPGGCNLKSITRTCYTLHLKTMTDFKQPGVILPDGVSVPVKDFTSWREKNRPSKCVTDVIDGATS